ncbi:MAG: hypothetical protein A4S09_15215 [Proteobacteria bacterium SG_bin7]|nr:MAG: hypothetical protein A4S09_15215 [Proteobacteria bacterium SG_bin7]
MSGCECKNLKHECKKVVLTGGPGAGKTAILEIVRKNFCQHISILPESASIIFGGGFWRHDNISAKKAAQRAIFFVQRELETLVEDEKISAIALCDRGTVDGLAYWPDEEGLFWKEVGTSRAKEFSRYSAVIHLRTPPLSQGYNYENPVRIESALQAAEIDKGIEEAWKGHPRIFYVESQNNFMNKVSKAIELIKSELPDCCKKHKVAELKGL